MSLLVVEMADKARDSDLVSFFDDFHELGHAEGSDSFGSSATSSEESDEVCRTNKPRRVRTYHGAADAHPSSSFHMPIATTCFDKLDGKFRRDSSSHNGAKDGQSELR